MKKVFAILGIILLMGGNASAQGLTKAIGANKTYKMDLTESDDDKERYKKVDFSVANSEGQLLHYTILPEGNNTVALVKMDGKKNRYDDPHYTIPATVSHNGASYTVTEIGKEVFYKCKVTSVTLPSTIKKIAKWGFLNSDINNITLNEGLKEIGPQAFAFCKLTSITIPSSVKYIRNGAFQNNPSLTSVTLNEGIEIIEGGAFWQTAITTAIIPNSIKEIGMVAFCSTGLKELSAPDNLRDIGKNAFLTMKSTLSYPKFTGMIHNLPSWITTANCEEYGIDKEAFNAYSSTKLAKQQSTPQVVYVQAPVPATAQPTTPAPQSTREKPSSDVDTNIPENAGSNENTFAVIIANENYQEESKVEYALNDGEMFKEYCQKTLGLPEENIHYKKDATLNHIYTEIDWLSQVAKAYNGEAKLIVYYAGHGIPDEANGSAYLLPIDGKGTNLRTGYSLAQFYKTLGELPSQGVTVFMDACFSGTKRGKGMLASARGVAIKAKPEAPKGKMVVFSAAQGDETAYPYEDKKHGLFTYFLLKKLQETQGNATLGELGEYIKQQVARRSIVTNGKSQTPTVSTSAGVGQNWKSFKLK